MSNELSGWVRWIARGLGSLAAVWWLFIGVAETISPHSPRSAEGAILGALVTCAVLGVLAAWWKERIGGLVLVLAGSALCVFAYLTAGHNKLLAVLVSGGPFLAAGILFLLCGSRP